MTISPTYTFTHAEMVDFLADYADWLAQEAEDDPAGGDLLALARRYLEESRPIDTAHAAPVLVGHCAICRDDRYAVTPHYDPQYRAYWLWTCCTCGFLLNGATEVPGAAMLPPSVPLWRVAGTPSDAGRV